MSRLDLTDPAELREARAEIERLRRERAELRAALRTYGRHHDTCGDMDGYNGVHPVRCDCGLDELREEG